MSFRSIFPELNRALRTFENDVRQLQNHAWRASSNRFISPASSSIFPLWNRVHGSSSDITDYPATSSPNWPAIDISEADNNYVLEAELPGVAKEDVSVEVDHNGEVVTVSGQVHQMRSTGQTPASKDATNDKSPSEQTDSAVVKPEDDSAVSTKEDQSAKPAGTYWAQERFYGSFRRAFQLPAAINPENVQASFRNGLLRVTMAKKEPVTTGTSANYKVEINDEDIKAKL
ncbi:HSP20-like chaperone [Syncephalis fuscata]|nr:HSP20-like chaperone [Syncephalis fuscata]